MSEKPLDEDGLCASCRAGETEMNAVYCYGEYEGNLRRLIHLFKYERIAPLAAPLGRLLAEALPREERLDGIVPVPLHWWKRFQRGFNQTDLLARELSRRTGIPVLPLVRRKRLGSVQAGLTSAQRSENVSGIFALRKGSQDLVRGKRLLVLDDVYTTGATANAMARLLRRAGSPRITVLAVARVDRRSVFQAVGQAHVSATVPASGAT